MIELVYGGSGSGKSEFAENEILNLNDEKKFYIATMKVCDEESRKKVERHKNLRKGKNFITIEASENLEDAAKIISKSLRDSEPPEVEIKKSCAILECLSNLVANEMFKDDKIVELEKVTQKVERGLEKLFLAVDDVVIVSNNIFDDGIEYDETTRKYQIALAKVNAFATSRADKLNEVVAGIAVKLSPQPIA